MSDGGRATAEVPEDAAVLDRIEADAAGAELAVLLVGPREVELVVARALLPADAVEGDWFRIGLAPDAELTAQRREDLAGRLDRIRASRSGGRFA
jgi:hypothetical protein